MLRVSVRSGAEGPLIVLIDRRNLWKLHGRWIVASGTLALLASGWTMVAAGRLGRWPGGGSVSGLALGALALAIIGFELAIVFKRTRWLRTARWTLSAQTWMKAHIWLGLLSVPLVVLHSGGRFGGGLTMALLAVFAIVIVSGLWGLALQNVLPRLLLESAPAETICSQIEEVGRQYAEEARRMVLAACGEEALERPVPGGEPAPLAPRTAHMEPVPYVTAQTTPIPGGSPIDRMSRPIPGAPRQVGTITPRRPHPAREAREIVSSETLAAALCHEIEPFLTSGAARGLGARQRNQWYFDDLRQRVPRELRDVVGQLEELCERRRQLNVQRRLHYWQYNWLGLHLSVSVALVVLVIGHVAMALRFG